MNLFWGEFVGTLFLILLGNGAVANVLLRQSKGYRSGWIVVTFGWAMAVTVGVYISQDFSGAHINPAVTLGFAAIGTIPWSFVPLYFLGQLLGAAAGAFLVWLAYWPHFQITLESKTKLLCYSTKPALNRPLWNLLTEVIATFVLLFAVMAIIDPRNRISGDLMPFLIGLTVLGIGISLGGPTGYAINPARDLGPRIMHAILPMKGKGSSEWGYAWIPVIGPFIGGVLGTLAYVAIFMS